MNVVNGCGAQAAIIVAWFAGSSGSASAMVSGGVQYCYGVQFCQLAQWLIALSAESGHRSEGGLYAGESRVMGTG